MIKWIAGIGAVVLAGSYLSRLSVASKNITSQVSVQIHKVTLSGIELRAMVRLQNPNTIRLRIQHPFVEIKHQGALVGTSILKNEIIDLLPNSERVFDLNIRSAGWITLIQTLGTELVQKIRKGKGAHFEITATTSTQVNNLPFFKEDILKISI